MNLGPSGLRKTIFSDDISCVNLIVAWTELAKSIKLLISALGKVHSKDVMDKYLPDERFVYAEGQ